MASSSCLMAAQSTLFLCKPTTPIFHIRRPAVYPLRSGHTQFLTLKPLFPSPRGLNPLKSKTSASSISPAPKNPAIKPLDNPNPFRYHLSGSTRTVTTLVATALTASKLFAHGSLFSLALALKEPLLSTAGPAFFAASASGVRLHTPLTLVAAGMAKWLDMYSMILYVRVMLSWFPNIPWEKQPFSAMREVCDPYLDLFKNIVPPIFNVLDLSSLLAFAVLGALGSILNSSWKAY